MKILEKQLEFESIVGSMNKERDRQHDKEIRKYQVGMAAMFGVPIALGLVLPYASRIIDYFTK